MAIDRKYLNDNCAALVAEILAEGRASAASTATEAAIAAARAEGATAERTRIQSVEAQALPGHETLIKTLKFDGQTTGEQAAVQVLAAERAKGGRQLAALNVDGKLDVPAAPSPSGSAPAPAADDKSRPVEERCKAKWEADAAVRSEFVTLGAYTAFMRAQEDGKVRILGAKKSA